MEKRVCRIQLDPSTPIYEKHLSALHPRVRHIKHALRIYTQWRNITWMYFTVMLIPECVVDRGVWEHRRALNPSDMDSRPSLLLSSFDTRNRPYSSLENKRRSVQKYSSISHCEPATGYAAYIIVDFCTRIKTSRLKSHQRKAGVLPRTSTACAYQRLSVALPVGGLDTAHARTFCNANWD